MFVGHYGAAFAARRLVPRLSLGWTILAAQLLDLIWPIFVLLGIERVEIDPGNTVVTPLDFVYYPWTHSLVTAAGWGALLAAIYFILRRDGRGASVLGGLVVSHWLLDFIVHRPDLPIVPHEPARAGLGLWNSLPATVAIELLLFAGGIALYAGVRRKLGLRVSMAFWLLVAFLCVIFVMNLAGPPPPNASAVAGASLSLWLLPLWGWWADRRPRSTR